MGSKQSLCPQKFCITDVFDNCPGNGQSVKGTGSTANLIQDQQTFRSRIAKNIGHLCHLHHERTLSAGQVVRSSDTGENPVYHTNLCFFCRNKRTNLRHQNDQGSLPHISGFSCHVRSGDHGDTLAAVVQIGIICNKHIVVDHLFNNRVAAIFDVDHTFCIDRWAYIVIALGDHG